MSDFLFVVGIGRSGTSLLQNMLNSHSGICFLPENSFIRRFIASGRFRDQLGQGEESALAEELATDVAFRRLGISNARLEEILLRTEDSSGAEFFQLVAQEFSDNEETVPLIGDKDPRLIEYLPTLRKLFPTAKVIHIVRDPRDVILSKTRAEWSRDRAMISNLFAGQVQWTLAQRTGAACFGASYLEVSYEELIRAPEGVMALVCSFLGLAFQTAIVSPETGAKGLVAQDEMSWKRNSLGPVISSNTEKWRSGLTPRQVALTEATNFRLIADVGYEVSAAQSSLSLLSRLGIRVQALLLNIVNPIYCRYRLWTQRK